MRIGCTACWLDPDITGEQLRGKGEICVIFDGNGYCFEHWKAVLKDLENRARTAGEPGLPLSQSQAVPLRLAGITLYTVEGKPV